MFSNFMISLHLENGGAQGLSTGKVARKYRKKHTHTLNIQNSPELIFTFSNSGRHNSVQTTTILKAAGT